MGFNFGRAAAGFAVGMGDTFLSSIQAERKDALEWAATQRKAELKEKYDIRSEKRTEEGLIAKEKREQEAKRGEINKDFKVDGEYTTDQDLLDAQQYNKETAPARDKTKADVAAREQEGFDTIKAEGNLLRTKDVEDARAYGAPTEEEKKDLAKKKITKVSEESAEQKADLTMKLKDMDIASREKIIDVKTDATLKIAEARLAAAQAKGSDSEVKQARLELKAAEERRKNLDSASRLLKETGGPEYMTSEQANQYNRYLKDAGEPASEFVSPPPAKPKKESKGLIGTVKEKIFPKPAAKPSSGSVGGYRWENGQLVPNK